MKCPDCGARGEREGHMECQYPGLRMGVKPRKRPAQPADERSDDRPDDAEPEPGLALAAYQATQQRGEP